MVTTIKNECQTAFHFLAERGYRVKQTPPIMPHPTAFPPIIQAVLSGSIEYLEILLEPRSGLYQIGKSYELALILIRKQRSNQVIRERIIELLISNRRYI